MQKIDAVGKELDEYEKLNVINNNAIDYKILRSPIDSTRKQSTSSSITGGEIND